MDLKIKYILNSKFQKILLYKNKYQNRNILFGRIIYVKKNLFSKKYENMGNLN